MATQKSSGQQPKAWAAWLKQELCDPSWLTKRREVVGSSLWFKGWDKSFQDIWCWFFKDYGLWKRPRIWITFHGSNFCFANLGSLVAVLVPWWKACTIPAHTEGQQQGYPLGSMFCLSKDIQRWVPVALREPGPLGDSRFGVLLLFSMRLSPAPAPHEGAESLGTTQGQPWATWLCAGG